jgi:capsular exopolysaccharide synthesis family protein
LKKKPDKKRNRTLHTQSAAKAAQDFKAAEAFKFLRTNLLFTLSEDQKIVVVTSAEACVGKSVVAANLAVSLAQTGARILLVDGDLRQPTQHRIFEQPNAAGLSTLLSEQEPIGQVIHPFPEEPGLFLLTAGPVPDNPAELLASEKMRSLLETWTEEYDYVLMDTPPVEMVVDSLSVIPRTAGAILIAKAGTTTADTLTGAADKIRSVKGKILGIVLNQIETKTDKRLYRECSRHSMHDSEKENPGFPQLLYCQRSSG